MNSVVRKVIGNNSAWQRLLLSAFLLLAWPLAANEVRNVRVWPSPDSTRVVLDLAAAPEYSHSSLQGPERLVIELNKTQNSAKLANIALGNGLVSSIGSSATSGGGLRLVLNLNGQAKPVLFPLKPHAPYGHRLVIDLYPLEAEVPVVVSRAAVGSDRDVVIAVDAGHGGEDPGAIGPSKTQEKRVTLAISKKVAALINAEPGMKAVLTRTGDYYVNLNRRSELARKQGADLLLSIHADAVESRTPRGASTWVLSSRRAQSELGRWLEQHEKHSELLGGAGDVLSDNSSERYLTHTLLDMSMDHSREVGFAVSRRVLDELGRVAHLHKRHPESASLAVLKAPDIPSLLIETGFISNPTEERKLGDSAYQQQLARAIVNGVRRHFHEAPPEGTLLAARKAAGKSLTAPVATAKTATATQPATAAKTMRHKVERGESLTLLAKRYNTSLEALVSANQLKDKNIRIGQWLTIPGQPEAVIAKASEPVTAPTRTVRHQVERGESLTLLAKRYNTTLDVLVSTNNLKDKNIRIGQWLTIPGQPEAVTAKASEPAPAKTDASVAAKASELVTAPTRTVRHQVVRGESLTLLAKRYNTSLEALVSTNNLKDKNIRIGQWLTIPGQPEAVTANVSTPAKTTAPVVAKASEAETAKVSDVRYQVKAGESLGLLAKRHNTTVAALMKTNKLTDPNTRIGQWLLLPAKAEATEPAAKATSATKQAVAKAAPAAKPAAVKHKVSRGESLTILAKRYNTSVGALVEVNGLRDKNIRIGQVLTIPQS